MAVAILSALTLSLLNAAAAIIIAKRAAAREIESFNARILGSMITRLFIMIGLAWIGISVFNNFKLAFTLTLIIGTFLSILGEILYIHFHKID